MEEAKKKRFFSCETIVALISMVLVIVTSVSNFVYSMQTSIDFYNLEGLEIIKHVLYSLCFNYVGMIVYMLIPVVLFLYFGFEAKGKKHSWMLGLSFILYAISSARSIASIKTYTSKEIEIDYDELFGITGSSKMLSEEVFQSPSLGQGEIVIHPNISWEGAGNIIQIQQVPDYTWQVFVYDALSVAMAVASILLALYAFEVIRKKSVAIGMVGVILFARTVLLVLALLGQGSWLILADGFEALLVVMIIYFAKQKRAQRPLQASADNADEPVLSENKGE